jgi:hypothetical protein
MHGAPMAARTAAHGVAETEEVVQVAIPEVGGPKISRSALTAVGNHRTLNLRNRCDRGSRGAQSNFDE